MPPIGKINGSRKQGGGNRRDPFLPSLQVGKFVLPILTTLSSVSLEVLVHRRHAPAQRRNKPKMSKTCYLAKSGFNLGEE